MTCTKCGGRMRIISLIDDGEVTGKIQKHLALPDGKVREPPKVKMPLIMIHIDCANFLYTGATKS